LLERYLRTDTIPYPGFSGGPLIDAAGGVVGMNTSGLAHGMALTVPAGLVWQIADSLAQHGRVKRGYLGVRSQPVELSDEVQQALGRQQELGLLMVGVEKNSPASAGGLMVGDILVSLAGSPISDPDELVSRLSGSIVGSPTQVENLRGGQRMTLTVVIGERK
jgi:S1-C subfamily serine protease